MTGPTGRLFVVADSSSLGLRRTRQTGRVLCYLNVVPRPVAPPRGPAPCPSSVSQPRGPAPWPAPPRDRHSWPDSTGEGVGSVASGLRPAIAWLSVPPRSSRWTARRRSRRRSRRPRSARRRGAARSANSGLGRTRGTAVLRRSWNMARCRATNTATNTEAFERRRASGSPTGPT